MTSLLLVGLLSLGSLARGDEADRHDESSTELWLRRLEAQKSAGVELNLGPAGVGARDRFVGFAFRPFSQKYVAQALKEGVDWRARGAVTPAKSQGQS